MYKTKEDGDVCFSLNLFVVVGACKYVKAYCMWCVWVWFYVFCWSVGRVSVVCVCVCLCHLCVRYVLLHFFFGFCQISKSRYGFARFELKLHEHTKPMTNINSIPNRSNIILYTASVYNTYQPKNYYIDCVCVLASGFQW